MSGGHLDYFFGMLKDCADKIYMEMEKSEEEKEVARIMRDLSKVLYELEWWLSGDTEEEQFLEEYKKFKKKWLKTGDTK